MNSDRHLVWDGCHNARDLGGLRTNDGRRTRWAAVVRSDSIDDLTPQGWDALVGHGVRTIIDLRNDDERAPETWDRPAEVTTVHVPLDDIADTALWDRIWAEELDGTPLYYPMFLDRKAERCAVAVSAVAQAPAGGVLIHCRAGRDRTGLITLLLLDLVGVVPDDIAADYELSASRLRAFFAARGMTDELTVVEAVLARKGASVRDTVRSVLEYADSASRLLTAGLAHRDLDAIRARLLDPG